MSTPNSDFPLINVNITTLKQSATLAINEKIKQMRKTGEHICHFGFGQSPFPVPPALQQALREASHYKDYLPAQGLYELREMYCESSQKKYGCDFHPSRVVIGPGSKELIFQMLFVLEGPLLIPAPSWVSYGPQAHIRGKQIHVIQTNVNNDYKLTPDELTQACESLLVNRQKILILNSPNNPTGAVYSEGEVKALSQVCRENGVIVISDEIYAATDFSGNTHTSFSRFYPEGTIVTSGLSKGHSAGGYRLGVLSVPDGYEAVLKALTAMISETFSAVSAPIQYAAIKAYEDDAEMIEYVRSCTAIHQATANYLYSRFKKMQLGCVKPQGAFYLFPDFNAHIPQLRKRGITTSAQLCEALLQNAKVATLPGTDFYLPADTLACRVASVDYDGEAVLKAAQNASAIDDDFIEANCPNLRDGCDRIQNFLMVPS